MTVEKKAEEPSKYEAAWHTMEALRRELSTTPLHPTHFEGFLLKETEQKNPCCGQRHGFAILVCMLADGTIVIRAVENVEMREGGQAHTTLEALGFAKYKKLLTSLNLSVFYRHEGAIEIALMRKNGAPRSTIRLDSPLSIAESLTTCLMGNLA